MYRTDAQALAFENPHPVVRWPSSSPHPRNRTRWYDREPRDLLSVDYHRYQRRGDSPWHRYIIPHAAVRGARLYLARMRGTHTREEWLELVERCAGTCPRCLARPFWPSPDHIIPIALGGSDLIENLQPICARCNLGKRDEMVDWLAVRGLRP